LTRVGRVLILGPPMLIADSRKPTADGGEFRRRGSGCQRRQIGRDGSGIGRQRYQTVLLAPLCEVGPVRFIGAKRRPGMARRDEIAGRGDGTRQRAFVLWDKRLIRVGAIGPAVR
jgi:hypothetical protein